MQHMHGSWWKKSGVFKWPRSRSECKGALLGLGRGKGSTERHSSAFFFQSKIVLVKFLKRNSISTFLSVMPLGFLRETSRHVQLCLWWSKQAKTWCRPNPYQMDTKPNLTCTSTELWQYISLKLNLNKQLQPFFFFFFLHFICGCAEVLQHLFWWLDY